MSFLCSVSIPLDWEWEYGGAAGTRTGPSELGSGTASYLDGGLPDSPGVWCARVGGSGG